MRNIGAIVGLLGGVIHGVKVENGDRPALDQRSIELFKQLHRAGGRPEADRVDLDACLPEVIGEGGQKDRAGAVAHQMYLVDLSSSAERDEVVRGFLGGA